MAFSNASYLTAPEDRSNSLKHLGSVKPNSECRIEYRVRRERPSGPACAGVAAGCAVTRAAVDSLKIADLHDCNTIIRLRTPEKHTRPPARLILNEAGRQRSIIVRGQIDASISVAVFVNQRYRRERHLQSRVRLNRKSDAALSSDGRRGRGVLRVAAVSSLALRPPRPLQMLIAALAGSEIGDRASMTEAERPEFL
ncbi:hypothetical protein EVAR_75919_1 [Eumeta japonica]|uniref:Uncharacterized protein n=1 Tax=Eumeta variegata TaxID=151549 RepID=A0A4C1UXG7_EUMVA|nr:hypothetical protein EVAR_75919_1 [Eumeta japonica]